MPSYASAPITAPICSHSQITQVTPVVSTLGNALTETPLHAAAPRTSCLAPRVRPAPRRPALLFGATPVPSAFVNDDDIARGRALHKLPQPKTTGLKRLSSPAKAKMAPESREERDTSLAQMEAVLSGYRELKDLRQRARAALHRATDTSNTQEAIDRNRSAVSQQRCESIACVRQCCSSTLLSWLLGCSAVTLDQAVRR